MRLQTFVYSELSIHSYVVVNTHTHECVVIDPIRLVTPVMQFILSQGVTLKAIIETHVHADFVSGSKELKHLFRNEPQIYCSTEGGPAWLPTYADKAVKDGDVIQLGNLTLKALHTPGHTPEHLTWLCCEEDKPVCAFTGDFLLVGGVGRPDLLGEQMTSSMIVELHRSLFERIAHLPAQLKILPAHGAGSLCGKSVSAEDSSTLEKERIHNPAFSWRESDKWQKELSKSLSAKPQTFIRNKRINLAGATLLDNLSTQHQGEELILDFRDPFAFSEGHMQGAINIPWGPSAGNWLAGVLTESEKILVILPEGDQQRIEELIRLLGYDQPIQFIDWESSADNVSLKLLSPHKLSHLIASKQVYLIDVRTPEEWNEGYLESAHHIELFNLTDALHVIPKSQAVVTMCRSGLRSSIAASLLQRAGFCDVAHLQGGINAWRAEKLPLMHVSL